MCHSPTLVSGSLKSLTGASLALSRIHDIGNNFHSTQYPQRDFCTREQCTRWGHLGKRINEDAQGEEKRTHENVNATFSLIRKIVTREM